MKRLLLATTVFALGCGATEPDYPKAPEIDAKFLGIWHVRTINGEPLPYEEHSNTEIEEGSITTGDGGVFSSSFEVKTTLTNGFRVGSEADGGNFSASGNTLTFHFVKAGTTATGTLRNDTLTVVESALTLALTR